MSAAASRTYGRTVGRGLSFGLGSTLFQRLTSFGAQWILGLLLVPEEFGVFATATSVAMFAQVLQDGGVRSLLIQRAGEYDALVGPAFWLASAMNLVIAALLALGAPLAMSIYTEAVGWNMLVIALAIAISSPATVLQARLAIDLRFGAISAIQVGSTLIRYGGTVGLAWAGMGALSFVIPLPFIAIYEGLAAWWITRQRPWSTRPDVARSLGLLRGASWVLAIALAAGVINLGSYAALGLVVTGGVVGVYYFGYMLVSQLGAMLANTLHSVLFPTLQKFEGDPARLRSAVSRSVRALMLVSAPSCLVLAPVFGPLERFLWQGKWSEAVGCMAALGLAFPFYAVLHVFSASQVARGAFRRSALMLGALGLGVVGAAAIGGATLGTAAGVAWTIGPVLGLGSLVFMLVEARTLGLSPGRVLGLIAPPWAIAVLSAMLVEGLDALVGPTPAGLMDGVRASALGAAYALVFVAGARVLIPSALEDLASVAPGKLSLPLRAVLRLPAPR